MHPLIIVVAVALASAEKSRMSECTAGLWKAWIDSTLVGKQRARALTHRMEVFRLGPSGPAPVKLYEETSTGSPWITLREDGLLVVQSDAPPRFYVPGEVEARTIIPPAPKKLEKAVTLHECLGKAYFLGDVLFYERTPYPGDLMIGFIEIDAAAKSFGRNIAVLEVRDSIGGSESWAASLGSEPILVNDHIFWLNRGQSNIKGIWRKRQLWALDLKSGKLVSRDQLPTAILRNPPHPLAELLRQSAGDK